MITNFKLPNFKFGKIKMDTVEGLENVKIDYAKLQISKINKADS